MRHHTSQDTGQMALLPDRQLAVARASIGFRQDLAPYQDLTQRLLGHIQTLAPNSVQRVCQTERAGIPETYTRPSVGG